MNEQYKSKGGAWRNERKEKGDNRPDFTGKITITKSQIDRLMEMGNAGFEVQLQISVWKAHPQDKQPTTDNLYLSIAAEAYMREEEQAPPAPPADEWEDDMDFPF